MFGLGSRPLLAFQVATGECSLDLVLPRLTCWVVGTIANGETELGKFYGVEELGKFWKFRVKAFIISINWFIWNCIAFLLALIFL